VYEQVSIVTPEGITLDLPLAGVGSRFIAAIIDTAIQVAILIALGLVQAGAPDNGVLSAVFIVAAFVLFTGYDIAFETLASGRTPGKRVTGLRVVTVTGAPVRFTTSAVRNVMRLIDILPGTYLVGIVSIVATKRNQRLGDLAAGTLVVRERVDAHVRPSAAWTPVASANDPADAGVVLAGWDVTAVTAEEVATVRRFLERRASLVPEARARLAAELAGRLRPKVATPDDLVDEAFLARVVSAKAQQR
jgi:uncharacterized RDD family membrane protein YckC